MIREELRWREGERLTRTTRTEHVAIGFQVREMANKAGGPGATMLPFEPTLHWIELTNMAKDPMHEFQVESEDLVAALNAVQRRFGVGNVRAHALWHSHFNLAQPTPFDIQHFPTWLAIGIVWFAPKDSIALYDGEGLVNTNAEELVEPLAAAYGPTH